MVKLEAAGFSLDTPIFETIVARVPQKELALVLAGRPYAIVWRRRMRD